MPSFTLILTAIDIKQSLKQKRHAISAFVACICLLTSFVTIAQENTRANDSQVYHFAVKGLSDDEYQRFRQYLVRFSGFESLELLSKTPSTISLNYISKSPAGLIQNNVNKVLEEMNIQAYLAYDLNAFSLTVISRGQDTRLRFGEW